MFNINDLVYIIPTGDPTVDAFLDQQLTIVNIIPVNDFGYHYIQYLLINADDDLVRVNSDEVRKAEYNA